ncbi:YceD family protein [Brevundimonas nasdae]|uniref:YceD family protein n=1 Tax=Brevundimonas nasdae TaxID=172043 RepID=UPI003F690B81
MSAALPYSETVRVNQIGAGLSRTLEPDADARKRIARALDLQGLEDFATDISITPTPSTSEWTLKGRVTAHAVQTCGLTLEPLPVDVDRRFSIQLVEAAPQETDEIEVTLDEEDADLIEDGKIDLGQYAVEQLALSLDPFPRKPGAEFVQPEEPKEISPFAALKALKSQDDQG